MDSIEILPPEPGLPIPYARRIHVMTEEIAYVARPGLLALPSGSFTAVAFAGLQIWTLTILLWAIWWPAPQSHGDWAFSLTCTGVLLFLVVAVFWLLLRRFPGFFLAILRAPFIRLTVTDRRVVWTLPWHRAPLLEIGSDRIIGGILGPCDRRGNGSAALMLIPGDPSADIDGAIHFDRLPDAAAFVAAVKRWW